MKENHFIYADLSTYDTDIAQKFYGAVFGWQYYDSANGYLTAYAGDREATGLYETPPKFKEMNMPPFWMSYIQVNSVDDCVAISKENGGIIEMVEENTIGKIALIRDPLGAGFTIYEGDLLNTRTDNIANTLVGNELFISDINQVKPFYEQLFNWQITAEGNDRYIITDSRQQVIGAINQVDNSIKGKYEYWSVFFAVDSVKKAKQQVLKQGGSLIWDWQGLTCLADASGGFFHVVAV